MTTFTVLAVFLLYLLLLGGIGLWGRHESHSIAGYYVAGKKLPSWIIAFSANATGESGWLLLGLTGMGYLIGIHALWVVLGEVLGVALGWSLVTLPFKEYTDRYGAITVPDVLEARFRDNGHLLRLVSAVIILSMVVVYIAAQLVAAGKAFHTFLDTSYGTGVVIGLGIILFYTTLGGFKAVAYADFVHAILMAGGLFTLALVGIVAAGGWMPLTEGLRAADPNLLLPMGEHGLSVARIASVLSLVGVGLAFLGVPQLLVRFISARGPDEIVSGSVMAVACIVVFDLGAVFAGMAGRVVFPGLADPETIMPLMSKELFPAFFTGLFVVIVLGAILSTVDSLLLLASSAVLIDLVEKTFRPSLSDRQLTVYGKLITVVLGFSAVPFALAEVRVIFWFVLFAWSGLAAAFVPVVLCALFWPGTTRAGALSGMIGGFLTTVVWVLVFKAQFYDLYEMIPGFAVGLALTILVSLVTTPPEGALSEWRSVRNAVAGIPGGGRGLTTSREW